MTDFACFNDGYLDGFARVGDKSLLLFLRAADGRRFTLALAGVRAMRMDDAQELNQIFELASLDAAMIADEQFAYVHHLQDAEDQEELVREARERAAKAEIKMLVFSPASGAVGMILYERSELREGWPLAQS